MTAGGETVLSVDGLSKRWSEDAGLAPVSFVLRRGQLTVVRGRSGSGKSTLLALLAGWASPDAGSYTWAVDSSRWADVAIVPQTFGLLDELSAAENIALAGAGVDAELVGALDLGGLLPRRPGELSMGQRQRVAVARALTPHPRCVLIDEPTSHQDGLHGAAIVEALRVRCAAGLAALVATHDALVIDSADELIEL